MTGRLAFTLAVDVLIALVFLFFVSATAAASFLVGSVIGSIISHFFIRRRERSAS